MFPYIYAEFPKHLGQQFLRYEYENPVGSTGPFRESTESKLLS